MAEPTAASDPEVEEAPTPVSSAAVSVALNRASRGKAALDADAGVFLREHTRMLGVQMEHLGEQRALITKHLQWRLFGDRVKGALQVLTLIAGAAIALGVADLVWSAHRDRGLVVEAFSVPPDLAQKGLTGQVMASLVLDRIAAFDAQAQSVRAASSYKNDWGDDIKVEIPTTGISLGELERWLRRSLGRETIISGAVYRTPAGLTVSVRAGESLARSANGSESDLDALVGKVAEAVYATTQPYRYSKYLESQGRVAEALVAARSVARDAPDANERAWAFAQVSNLLELQGDMEGGVAAAREALALKPTLALGAINWTHGEQMLGHDEAALHGHRLVAKLLRGRGDIAPAVLGLLPLGSAAPTFDLVGDYGAAQAAWAAIAVRPNFQGWQATTLGWRAFERAKAHDSGGSRALRALAVSGDIDVAYAPTFETSANTAVIPQYYEAVDVDDWSGALAHLDATIAATAARGPAGEVERQRFLIPRRAYVLARLGRQAEAVAAIAGTPLDCYLCVRTRGRVAAIGGDSGGAAHWFAAAIVQAPSLPFAYEDWGEMLLAKGDVAGAIGKFRAAHKVSAHFADALELWGEALIRQGDARGAGAKFAEAARYAPRWGRLHLMWGEALASAGKDADATEQFKVASTLDLSLADRQALTARR